MVLKPEDPSIVGSDPLKDAISIEKSVVEDGDCSLFLWNKLSVKINQIHRASQILIIAEDKWLLIVGLNPISRS